MEKASCFALSTFVETIHLEKGYACFSFSAALLAMMLCSAAPALAASCESLPELSLPDTTITSAEVVAPGHLTLPPSTSPAARDPLRDLPYFCRVTATIEPVTDSSIKIEVWLPASGWNGKFLAVGNLGWGGIFNYADMGEALRAGFAVGSTDTGHEGNGAGFAIGHPEKVIDFGYRSAHEMTVKAKEITASFYGNAPQHSYWKGCSSGARQGLKEAQIFPSDYDGIIAGAPAADHIGRAAQAVNMAQSLEANESARLSPEKSRILHEAVLAVCDTLDGVKDGIIENPMVCKFDPAGIQCKGTDETACLTASQVRTARMLYTPGVNPRTKRELGALAPGSELGWTDLGWSAGARSLGFDYFRFVVHQDPDFTLQKFSFASDLVRAEEIDHDTINAIDPNLKPFFDRGGKLLLYHGWTDPQISPYATVNYYQSVIKALDHARNLDGSMRLFMVPGMNHCWGGDGTDHFDPLAALEGWVEKGKEPDSIIAAHTSNGKIDRTHPLCPYPQTAHYKGSGSTDDAANFVCKAP
jgi:feruloyl esterase